MKAPIASSSFVAFGVVVGTICAGAWSGAARTEETRVADPARPGACSAAIARVETVLSRARANGHVVASAPESVTARLHRQPTRESVANAVNESEKRIEDSLEIARKLRSDGKRSECVAMLEKVSWSLGMR